MRISKIKPLEFAPKIKKCRAKLPNSGIDQLIYVYPQFLTHELQRQFRAKLSFVFSSNNIMPLYTAIESAITKRVSSIWTNRLNV